MPLVQTGYRRLCSASLTNRWSQPLADAMRTFDFETVLDVRHTRSRQR